MIEAVNRLGRFCGKRDVDALDRAALNEKYGIDQADVMVLFGGSVLAGGDLLAKAIKDGIASTYVIVGGAGHTTETLRSKARYACPALMTDGLPEAVVFQKYLQAVHGCQADYLETESTNCGNNITHLLALIREKHIRHRSVILCQDATMQARMDAGMRKYAPEPIQIINYASYRVTVRRGESGLTYAETVNGMWDIDRYINLLMGEIPRLTDDENGYGPNGKRFIAHVDVPEDVKAAFARLKTIYGMQAREADPAYASNRGKAEAPEN